MNWQDYFKMMVDWKKLPAYRAEPRIDSLIGFYLPEMISDFLSDKIVGIIPEFPLRLGTLKPGLQGTIYAERSYKVDFYLLGASGTNYFIEFKTDSGSRNDSQDKYLKKAAELSMNDIVEGIICISKASTYKMKYSHLLNKLKSLRLLDESGVYVGQSEEIRVVYVQPRNKDGAKNCIGFSQVAEWMKRKGGIDSFESHFVAALNEWAKD